MTTRPRVAAALTSLPPCMGVGATESGLRRVAKTHCHDLDGEALVGQPLTCQLHSQLGHVPHPRELSFWEDDGNLARSNDRARGNFLLARKCSLDIAATCACWPRAMCCPVSAWSRCRAIRQVTPAIESIRGPDCLDLGRYRPFSTSPDCSPRRIHRIRLGPTASSNGPFRAFGYGQCRSTDRRPYALG